MTRYTTVIVTSAMLAACVPQAKADPAIYSPEAGVVCDRKAGFCSDFMGISMGFSELFLGSTSEYKAFEALMLSDKPATPPPDPVSFTFSDGTHCDVAEKWCSNAETGAFNEFVTKTLFGSN